MPEADPTVLEVEDLTVTYQGAPSGHHAVDHVGLSIAAGEIVALIGESGSGKSTLSRAVVGLLPSQTAVTGRIRIRGVDVGALPERQRARTRGRLVAMVPQDPGTSLDPVHTIGSQVTEIFRLHRGTAQLSRRQLHERAAELLHVVGIDHPAERLHQYPHELSGGMKQRVLIAMAFGLEPALLIADEPTSALDVTVQKQVLDVFDRLAEEAGVAVLFVTHNLAVAADRARRALVMRAGRIVDRGPIEDLVLRPGHPYTHELIGQAFGAASPAATRPRQPVASGGGGVGEDGEPAALRVTGLTKRFPRIGRSGEELAAVDDVSFAVDAGTTVALVGESGSGKSTTARLILGLTRPTSGQVEILGRDTTAARGEDRRRVWRDVQLVYQNPQVALDPRFSVERIIEEPLRAAGVRTGDRRDRVRALLERVGLQAALLGRKPRELSGGQGQRVAIARALALHSRLIILDEALSALDVLTQARILDLLAALQAELSLSYLFISHDLEVVRSICQTVAVMQRGRLVESGPTEQVFSGPQHPYTQGLIESIPGARFRARLDRARVGTVLDTGSRSNL